MANTPPSPNLEALRERADKFIDSEANFRLLNDFEYGRKHLELLLMQFAADESRRTAIDLREVVFPGRQILQ